MRSELPLGTAFFRRCILGLSALALASLTGCASYNSKSEEFVLAYKAGDTARASQLVTEASGTVDAKGKSLDEQSRPDMKDRLLFRLEQGSIYRWAGDYPRSLLAFQHARQLVEKFDQDAKIKLGQEGAALVTNMTALDYRGQVYDRVMLSTYNALNYLELGDIERARPEILAAYARQQEAVARYADDIEAQRQKALKDAEKKGREGGGGADVNRSLNDPQTKSALDKNYAWVDQMAGYENYVNPFAEYLQGLYFTYAGVDASDRERGRKSFEKVRGLLPNNRVVASDYDIAASIAAGAPAPKVTYVIFETGIAPRRMEIRIDIPIFIVNVAFHDTGVDYVGMAFPILKKDEDFLTGLNVAAGATSARTEVVADMDKIVAREFKNELPAIITKTIAASATKAALAYAANKATENTNAWVNIGTRILTTAYQVGANQADVRTWRTLPKQFQVARIETPADRQLRLTLPTGAALPTVTLIPGDVNVVYVHSTSAISPIQIHQFALRGGSSAPR